MEETFLLSNMSPQVGVGFNRGAWKNLEEKIRNVAKKSLYTDVISGPLYLSKNGEVRYRVIGPNNIAVPTHFFKVMLATDLNRRVSKEAWIMPNREILKSESLSGFISSIEQVELGRNLVSVIKQHTRRL